MLLLWNALAQRGGAAPFERTGYGALHLGETSLLDPHELRKVPLLRLLRQRPAPAPRMLAKRLPTLESDHVVLFQYPPDPDFDLLAIMEEENRRTAEAPNMRRVERRLVAFRGPHGKDLWALQPADASDRALLRGNPVWVVGWGARATARLGQRRASYYVMGKPFGCAP